MGIVLNVPTLPRTTRGRVNPCAASSSRTSSPRARCRRVLQPVLVVHRTTLPRSPISASPKPRSSFDQSSVRCTWRRFTGHRPRSTRSTPALDRGARGDPRWGLGWLLIVGKQVTGELASPLDVYHRGQHVSTVMAFPTRPWPRTVIAALGCGALAFQRHSRGCGCACRRRVLLGVQHGYDLLIVYVSDRQPRCAAVPARRALAAHHRPGRTDLRGHRCRRRSTWHI